MRFLVSADNPGGANAISSVVKQLIKKGNKVVVILGGSAKAIFKDAGLSFIANDLIEKNKLRDFVHENQFDIFLSGTSQGETVDKILLNICKGERITTVCILDSWVNYWMRFDKGHDQNSLPDYICIMDELAKREMLDEGFPPEKLVVTGNPFFDDFVEGINCNQEELFRVLFVSQPLAEAKKTGGLNLNYDEYSVLEDLLDVFKSASGKMRIAIRLHPREEAGKFDEIIKQNKIFSYDKIKDVKTSLSRSGLIIGMNSMVLVQAALAQKRVISYQPGLKGNDILITNKFNLSRLVTSKEDFVRVLNDTASFKLTATAEGKKFMADLNLKNATNNVLCFLNSLKI